MAQLTDEIPIAEELADLEGSANWHFVEGDRTFRKKSPAMYEA